MKKKMVESFQWLLLRLPSLNILVSHLLYVKWLMNGKPVSSPHIHAKKVVLEYAKKYNVHTLVETGTYRGDMLYGTKNVFKQIYSIELNEELCQRAQNRFSKYKHISIIRGDSSQVLAKILPQIKEPCLFWLDAHYSGWITSQIGGGIESPILEELRQIFDSNVKCNVILMDDARCFLGEKGYPKINELMKFVLSKRPNWEFEVKDDIIRTYQKL